MTPKEKAIKLVDDFLNLLPVYLDNDCGIAKQCALISVDEILKAIKGMVCSETGYSANEYYKEVKEEINKL